MDEKDKKQRVMQMAMRLKLRLRTRMRMRMAHREACRVFTPISQEGRPMDQGDQAHALNQPGGGERGGGRGRGAAPPRMHTSHFQ